MSEEEKEAIEIVKDITFRGIRIDVKGNQEDYEAIETILNYIDKLENENSSLKKEIKLMKSVNINENFISKDKIRNKIKELEKEKKFFNGSFSSTFDYTIKILKELLGE